MVEKIEFLFDGNPPRRRVVRGRDVLFEDPYVNGEGWLWPMPETTGIIGAGLTYGDLTPFSGDLTTSANGQLIEELDITGRIIIQHDNVTVRKCRVRYNTNYGLDNQADHSGLVVEDTEFDGSLLQSSGIHAAAGHSYAGGYVLRRVYLHNAVQGFITYGNTVIEDSWLEIMDDIAAVSGEHREAVLGRGSNHAWTNSVFICGTPEGGCSAAAVWYSVPAPNTNCLLEDSFVAGACGYCFYGGASEQTGAFTDDSENVRILNNAFDRRWVEDGGYKDRLEKNLQGEYVQNPDRCGRSGDITAFDASGPGNVSSGNYYWPDLLPLGTPNPNPGDWPPSEG